MYSTMPEFELGPSRWVSMVCTVFALLCCVGAWSASHAQEAVSAQADNTAPEPPAPPPSPPCSLEESRQFDFWVGSWDLSWKDGGAGTNEVTSDYNGCVIRENFSDSTSPYRGMSVSVYNAALEIWKQTWVDSGGSYLDFVGGFEEDGTMRLSREAVVDGKAMLQRMTFYNIEADSIDWDWEVSTDNGESWELRWRIHYSRQDS